MSTRFVESTIRYLGPCDGKPVFHERRRDLDRLPLEPHSVRIEDLRHGRGTPSLDEEGFALVRHPTTVSDFFDPQQRPVYLRETEALLRELTGAARVVAFPGGVLRRSERSPGFGAPSTSVPGRFAHCDFSPNAKGSRYWIESMLPSEQAQACLSRRFAIYTAWRVLSEPPQDTPLAVCDARSVRAQDCAYTDCVIDPLDAPEIRFENTVFRYGSSHRWGYFSNMTRGEVLLLRGFDSHPDRTTGVPHVAFDDPSCPSNAPARESIDVRAFAFFDD